MTRKNPQVTHRTAHQRILTCKKEKRWLEAIEILASMREAGHKLGTVSYNAAIDACGKAKQVDRALELFEQLHMAGNVPDAVTYTALIDACGRAGLLDQAFALFSRCVLLTSDSTQQVSMMGVVDAMSGPGTRPYSCRRV